MHKTGGLRVALTVAALVAGGAAGASADVAQQTAARAAAAASPQTRAASPQPRPASPATEAAALQEFQKRLEAYLDLRSDLAHKLEPLEPTADAAELATRQEALAAALKTARQRARQGDMIPPLVAERIRTVVREDLKSRAANAGPAPFGEIPKGVRLSVNRTFPKDAALPTVPPLLLGKLPPLPDNLQYRFVNRDVVLLDGDTQIIVDYVSHVLPPH